MSLAQAFNRGDALPASPRAPSASIAPARPVAVSRLAKIPLPVWVQPKHDGVLIRILADGRIETKQGLPLQSVRLALRIDAFGLRAIDCELVAEGSFAATLALLKTGRGNFTLWGLDRIADPRAPRYDAAADRLRDLPNPRAVARIDSPDGIAEYRPTPAIYVTTRRKLQRLTDQLISAGAEGIVARAGTAPYGVDIWKFKHWRDAEAHLVETIPGARNFTLLARWNGVRIRVQASERDTAALAALQPGDIFTFTYLSTHASGQPREARFLRSREGDPS